MMFEEYIPSLTQDELTKAVDEGVADAGTKQLLEKEAAVIRAYRRRSGRPSNVRHRTGLALSGGGIRSAAFSLGVLQALAAKDILKRIDYLSSVSGGSYTAASLSWFLGPKAGSKFGVGAADFPYGVGHPKTADSKPAKEQAALLTFLRQHGAYLTPGHGITLISAVAAVLRGVLLNLLVWFPILVVVMGGLLAIPGLPAGNAWFMKNSPAAFRVFLWAALCLAGVFVIACILYSFSTYFRRIPHTRLYLKHRLFESNAYLFLYPILVFGTLASLPFLADTSFGWFG
ncbi:MAG: patatin-like phospholipase family protein, partial [Thermodesulfobacteriota bacterium]